MHSVVSHSVLWFEISPIDGLRYVHRDFTNTTMYMYRRVHIKRPCFGTLERGWAGGVGQDHVHCHFVWRNAKSFYCFSPWKKAALRFQCILKSNLHAKTVTKLGISHYTPLRACTEQLCKWPCRLTENISECRLVDRTQVFSIRLEVNKAIEPHRTPAISQR